MIKGGLENAEIGLKSPHFLILAVSPVAHPDSKE